LGLLFKVFFITSSNLGATGIYYVRVKDVEKYSSSLFQRSFVSNFDAEKPAYTITGGGTYCFGEPIDPVVVNFTGRSRAFFYYFYRTECRNKNRD
jgi:hypothetical protein